MRAGWFLVVLFLVPSASAGTQAEPELTDPANDVTFYPSGQGPYPLVDWTKAWISEDASGLHLHMEVNRHLETGLDVPNGPDDPRYIIGVHVNGERDDPCGGWGTFNLDAWRTATGYQSYLRVFDPYDGDGCGGTDVPGLPASIDDNVVTLTLPWDTVPGLVARGDNLTLADTRAMSSLAWPTSMRDFRDEPSSGQFTVTLAPPRNETVTAQSSTDSAPAPSKESPAVVWPLVAAALFIMTRRHRA